MYLLFEIVYIDKYFNILKLIMEWVCIIYKVWLKKLYDLVRWFILLCVIWLCVI